MTSATALLNAAGAVALAITLAACGSTHPATGSGSPAAGPGSPGAASSPRAMAQVSAPARDIAFAQGMIPHHAQAVEMSDLALIHAASPQVKALAEQIKAAQGPEIELMDGWLAAWGAPTGSGADRATQETSGGHDGGHDMDGMDGTGMMTAADMTRLGSAHGAGFDRLWLEMMIDHHEGAIIMARDVLATTNDPGVRRLAQGIIDSQAVEVETMRGLLAG